MSISRGHGQTFRRNAETERPGGPAADDELVFGRPPECSTSRRTIKDLNLPTRRLTAPGCSAAMARQWSDANIRIPSGRHVWECWRQRITGQLIDSSGTLDLTFASRPCSKQIATFKSAALA